MATTEQWPFDYNWTNLETLEGNFTVAPTIEAFFDGDLLLHPFWYQYRPMIESIPPIVHYFLGIFIAVVGIIGISGNFLIIYMFLSNKSLRTPSNLFIINMAFSDLGFSAVNGFPLMTISSFMRKWYFGKTACELYGFAGGLFGFNSINSLAWISYDRMFVITKPFEAMRKSTMKRSGMQLIIVWSWALIWALPPLFGWGAYIPEGFMTSCSFDYLTQSVSNITYVWGMFVFAFIAPVLMIVYCYYAIIKAVTSQNAEMTKTAEKMGAETDKDKKAKARAREQEIALAKVAAVTVTFFMLSWLPYALVTAGGMAGYTWIINPYTCVVPVMFAKSSSIWNPLLYSLSHPRFRAVLDEMFPQLVLFRDMCMDKGGDDDAENSEAGPKDGKKKGKLGRTDSANSEASEISEIESVTVVEDQTQVQMAPNPQQRGGGGGGGHPSPRPQQPQGAGGPRPQLQPQQPRVAPGGGDYAQYQASGPTTQGGRRRSFRQSIGRAAGEAYKNLIDAYVGLKNVSDKLGDKRAAMVLQDNHPASRRSSSVGVDNPAYNSELQPGSPNGSRSTSPVGVYSVPTVMYQQPCMPQMQQFGYGYPPQAYGMAPGVQMVPGMGGPMMMPGMLPQQQLFTAPAAAAPAAADAAAPATTVPAATSPAAPAAPAAAATPPAATPQAAPAAVAPAAVAPAATPAAATSPAAPVVVAPAPAPAPTPAPAITTTPATAPPSPAIQTPAAPSPAAPTASTTSPEAVKPAEVPSPAASSSPPPPPPPPQDAGEC